MSVKQRVIANYSLPSELKRAVAADALLDHDGNDSAAARDLLARGLAAKYGDKLPVKSDSAAPASKQVEANTHAFEADEASVSIPKNNRADESAVGGQSSLIVARCLPRP